MKEEEYMNLAIALAKKGAGHVNPNPLVGAILVKDNRIIGQGYHEQFGGPHAERNAIKASSESVSGATLYVTLEPCCHYGKQPPCTDVIIENKIRKVVVGSTDPNPLVAGKGIRKLKECGIEVVSGVNKKECDQLNAVFFHYIRTNTPYVVYKYAMTMDGKIATVTGESKWITCEEARERVQQDRNLLSGIMVGVGTILSDDPRLSCRIPGGRDPVRIICDTNLRTPLSSVVVKTASKTRTILATAIKKKKSQAPYIEAGCEIIVVPKNGTHIDLRSVMRELGKKQIDGILLEGGPTLAESMLKEGIVNRIQTYIAPKIFGGANANTPVGGTGISNIKDCIKLNKTTISKLGEDYLMESEVADTCLPES